MKDVSRAVINGKRVAYAAIFEGEGEWTVAICVEGERGYHPVSDYGPYATEERAKLVVGNLNRNLGLDEAEAITTVLSTMGRDHRRLGVRPKRRTS